MIKLFKVEGNSLYPLLKDGQRVLCRRVFANTKLSIGDFVVFNIKGYPKMIKIIDKIEDKKYFLQGTTIESKDSRDFGLISKNQINYKIIL